MVRFRTGEIHRTCPQQGGTLVGAQNNEGETLGQHDQHSTAGEAWTIRIRRNPSWLDSVRVTLVRVIFYGPSAWWWLVGSSVKALLTASVIIPAMKALWILNTVWLVILGLAGFVTEPEEEAG